MEYTILNNGVKMPMVGFGVFQVQDPKVCEQAVLDAISVGQGGCLYWVRPLLQPLSV